MRFGYARVSTDDQDLSLQLQALHAARCTRIWKEKASASSSARPMLERLLDQLREGDTLVVWRLDRLARGLRELLALLERIETAGASLRSCTEPVDTSTAAGRVFVQLLAAFGEFERSTMIERTRAGLAAARARGVRVGRPRSLDSRQVRAARAMLEGGASLSSLARRYGVGRTTMRKYLRAAEL